MSEQLPTAITALLIEDDLRLAQFTIDYLSQHGVFVSHATDGAEGLNEAIHRRFDVIILDLMLPSQDGLSVCQQLRSRSDVPIVIITARAEETDRVLGLELGADDYVIKPYSPRELLARLRAVVRRDRGQAGPPGQELRVGPLYLDTASRRALLDERELELTTYEFDLLLAMAKRPGRVLSREQLLELVKGSADDAFDRSVDVHVSRLRQKLGDSGRRASLVKTVRGVGYMLAEKA